MTKKWKFNLFCRRNLHFNIWPVIGKKTIPTFIYLFIIISNLQRLHCLDSKFLIERWAWHKHSSGNYKICYPYPCVDAYEPNMYGANPIVHRLTQCISGSHCFCKYMK